MTHVNAPDWSLVVPVYNEAATLAQNLAELTRWLAEKAPDARWELILVDDGSRDASAAIARDWTQKDARLRLVTHDRNRGLAAALRSGLAATRGRIVVILDADLSYHPDHIAPLCAAVMGGADVAVASPYMPGGRVRHVPALRLLASRMANGLLARAGRFPLHTVTGMVRAYRGDLARSLPIEAEGMQASLAMLVEARARGARLVEVPAQLDWRTADRDRGRRSPAWIWGHTWSSLRALMHLYRTSP